MSPGDILQLLSGGLGTIGIVVLALFITGQIVPKNRVTELREEVAALKLERNAERERADAERQRADAERERSNVAVTAAQGTRDLMAALQAGILVGRRALGEAERTDTS